MLYHDSQNNNCISQKIQSKSKRSIHLLNTHSHIIPSPPTRSVKFDDHSQYRQAHGHDDDHENHQVAHDLMDNDDSHEFIQELPLVEDKPWGDKYDRPRLVCLVPTLWPKKKFVMEV